MQLNKLLKRNSIKGEKIRREREKKKSTKYKVILYNFVFRNMLRFYFSTVYKKKSIPLNN